MKVVLQRSKQSKVTIDGKINGKIDHGYVALVSFTNGDSIEIIDKMIKKIINLRVFTDENDKMNLSILDTKGSILSISQFTLYADTTKGNRPSYKNALNGIKAGELYKIFNERLQKKIEVQTGKFGANMLVKIENDGPITIALERRGKCE